MLGFDNSEADSEVPPWGGGQWKQKEACQGSFEDEVESQLEIV